MPKIILATIGSLGDLHPFIAIGLALKERGAEAVLAVPEDFVGKCRAAGLEAQALLPSFQEVGRSIGLPDEEIVRRVLSDNDFLLRRILLPPLADGTARLLRMGEGADAVVGSAFALAAAPAAERMGVPYVHVVLQPLSWFSALDPPRGLGAPLVRRPAGPVGRAWNRAALAAGKRYLRLRYGGRVDRVRRGFGLPPSRAAPAIEPGTRPALSLGTYSPVLGSLSADVEGPAALTGFPWFDSETGAPPALDPALERFLRGGPAPLVVSLGSFVPFAGPAFYERAAEAARAVGLRAVLLTGEAEVATGGPDVLAVPYAPHSLLFPRAAAVVHHGGIGTTGQALRAGRPQVVTPFMADQPDNAARVERLGAGLTYRRGDLAATLGRLLGDPRVAERAREVGARVAAEDGAGAAADAILSALARKKSAGRMAPPGV